MQQRIRSRRLAGRFAVVAVFVGVALGSASVTQAEDFGDWAAGCASGWTCFYVGLTGGTANSATTRDSNFSNNPAYPNGVAMDKHVHGIANKFVGTTKVQAYQSNNYVTATGFCLSPGVTESPISSDNVSSYKSC